MPSAYRKQQDRKRKKHTRQQLLNAAARVFARNGYHNTLISDIVSEAGTGQGTFYRNFGEKRDIFETLLERFVSELFDEFSPMSEHLPANVREYRDASLTAILRVARIVERNRALCLVFLREAPTVHDDIAEAISEMYDRLSDLAKRYLDHAIANGFARPCRSDVVGKSIVGMGVHMAELWLKGDYSGFSIDELVTETVDFAFLGLAPRDIEADEYRGLNRAKTGPPPRKGKGKGKRRQA